MDAAVLSEIGRAVQTYGNLTVASAAVLVYDCCITFGLEVELIWKAKFSVVTMLYLLSRYLAIFATSVTMYFYFGPAVPTSVCSYLDRVSAWSLLICIGVAHLILLVRTYALWFKNKIVLYGLLLLFSVAFGIDCWIMALFMSSRTFAPSPLPIWPGCFPSSNSSVGIYDYVTVIIYECVILFLTLISGYKRFRHSATPLLTILYRDGVLFFSLLFALSLGNVLTLVIGTPKAYLTTLQSVFHSMLSTRILLHAREAAIPNEHLYYSGDGSTADGAGEWNHYSNTSKPIVFS
jgi:hypothetical protein